MQLRFALVIFFAAGAVYGLPVSSTLKLPSILASNMVIQRDTPFNFWGEASPGVVVSVMLSSSGKVWQTRNTTASSAGDWIVTFDAAAGTTTPHNIKVVAETQTIELTNVVFGDVMLCSGQSNMQFVVLESINGSEVASKAHFPYIRLMQVARDDTFSDVTTPQKDVKLNFAWSEATSQNVVGYFSAACFFMAVEIQRTMADLPIGLIDSSWGGTSITVWSPEEVFTSCQSVMENSFTDPGYKYDTGAPKNGFPMNKSCLWNTMIYPFLNFAIKGATFYQGESDAGNPTLYACTFPAMITAWRKHWSASSHADAEFAFVFVQLSTWPAGGYVPNQRWAQTSALALNRTGMAVAMDIGNLDSPSGNIHPWNKQEVGRRMALNMLTIVYQQQILAQGPVPQAVQYTDTGSGLRFASIEIKFANVGPHGLDLLVARSPFNGFEILTYTTDWSFAEAAVTSKDTVRLTFMLDGGEAEKPVTYVRYAWSDIPLSSLHSDGLPAPPFVIQVSPSKQFDAPKFLAPGALCPTKY